MDEENKISSTSCSMPELKFREPVLLEGPSGCELECVVVVGDSAMVTGAVLSTAVGDTLPWRTWVAEKTSFAFCWVGHVQ